VSVSTLLLESEVGASVVGSGRSSQRNVCRKPTFSGIRYRVCLKFSRLRSWF